MSDQTKQAVEDALLAHLLDECGEEPWLLTDWLTVVAARSADLDRTNYVHLRSDSPWHVHIGLSAVVERSLNEFWNRDD